MQGRASKASNLSCSDVIGAGPAEKSERPVCGRKREELTLSPPGAEERAQVCRAVSMMQFQRLPFTYS